ncbi:nucleoside ABC transporter membrane protein [Alkalispirochaeta americana]|uniref:Nucleoside ABC transporter membrane protein n=1 Tax=Alkalispirochaeta americana TaxID=159291 RepID=A0A1N6PRA4_9SPIO|nr:ABC transporter permease [Alkalispirochaeta americana]SIQ06873.1 nucleoside ABC transporter membrane protein [Alkalispirochaeta americana]
MIAQVLQSSSFLLIAALGGLVAERSGILNIGLEGMIALGAFTAVAAHLAGLGPLGSILAATLAGVVPALIFGHFVLRWRANPFIVGLAINLLSAGTIPLLSETLLGTRGSIRLPSGGGIPIQAVPVWALIVLILVWGGLFYTVPGLRLRVAGEEPRWLRANHVGVAPYQLLGLIVSGIFSALAGALLALRIGAYLPGISAGRGWIALVIIYLGYRRPWGLAGAALLFGLLEAVAVRAQATAGVSPTVLLALPYLLTVIAFVAYCAFFRRRA